MKKYIALKTLSDKNNKTIAIENQEVDLDEKTAKILLKTKAIREIKGETNGGN